MVKLKDVYATVIDPETGSSTWSRIGVAFVRADQSLQVILDRPPAYNRLLIQDPKPVHQTKTFPQFIRRKQ